MNTLRIVEPLVDSGTAQDIAPTFDDFWTIWPAERRVCKKQAREAWAAVDPKLHVAILVALVAWRKVWAARGEYEYVVHPHRWLRNERWEDALPVMPTSSSASHVAAALPEPTARTVMPEHVKALLAKMRNGKG